MKSRRIILTILCAIISTTLYAQKLSLGYLYPAGGQVGTTVVIEAGGLNINKATKVLFNHPGITADIEPLKDFSPDDSDEDRQPVRLDLRGRTHGEIAAVLQYNYPIFTDDFRFRMEPHKFEKLRNEYQYRREIVLE